MNQERKKFEARFDTATKEVLVLVQEGVSAGRAGNAVLWDAQAKVLAYIDSGTGEMIQGDNRLTWQITEEERKTKEKIFDIGREQIYRLKVRESLPYIHDYSGESIPRGRYLMLAEVLERNCKDSRLEEILVEYQKPVAIKPEGCSELLLDKSLGTYDGDCQWNGEECMVHLDVDGKGLETAKDAIATLAKLMADSADWDGKARKLAASKLVDIANDWQEDEDEDAPEITEEDFARRLIISELCASTDGDFEIFYDDDDMFWGHVIIVSGNIEDCLTDATMAG